MKQVTMWRLGIRDAKRWDLWRWSQNYSSFDELISASKAYLESHPGSVIIFRTEKVFIP